jgi:hypothetical protein
MFNRSKIMKAAWAMFRQDRAYYVRNGYCLKILFRDCLTMAWGSAKREVFRHQQEAADMARKQGARIAALREAIQDLDYKPFGMRITAERRKLAGELVTLMGEAA